MISWHRFSYSSIFFLFNSCAKLNSGLMKYCDGVECGRVTTKATAIFRTMPTIHIVFVSTEAPFFRTPARRQTKVFLPFSMDSWLKPCERSFLWVLWQRFHWHREQMSQVLHENKCKHIHITHTWIPEMQAAF